MGTRAHALKEENAPKREYLFVMTTPINQKGDLSKVALPMPNCNPNKRRGKRFNVYPMDLVSNSSDFDFFQDAKDEWEEATEEQGKKISHDKISSLLEGIDHLLDCKIREPQYSLDEEKKQIAEEIWALGKRYQAYQHRSCKAEKSSSTGFHMVPDLQPTKSKFSMKRINRDCPR